MDEWKYLQKLRQSERRGMLITAAVITGIIAFAALVCFIVKYCISHNVFNLGCCDNCGCGDFDDEDDNDDDDDNDNDDDEEIPAGNADASGNCDENGCCYTNDKDFV